MNIKPQSKTDKTPKQRKKKVPKKITPTYLHNSGLYYLQRFVSSSENFRQVMLRKVKKSCHYHKDQDYQTCAEMVDETLRNFMSSGLLNDDLYTKGVVTSLRRAGKSRRMIIMKLKHKGISADKISAALEAYDQETHANPTEAELNAALVFARKKRLGPFLATKEIPYEKALAAMARAGFAYDTCKKVFDMTLEDAQNLMQKNW